MTNPSSGQPNRANHRLPDKRRQRLLEHVKRLGTKVFNGRRGLGLTTLAVATSLVAQGSIVTDASWNDEEWVHSSVGTTDCAAPEGDFAVQSSAEALSGSVLGVDLDDLADVQGISVVNDGTEAAATAGSPVPGIPDAWSNPLTVEALSAIEFGLDGVLDLPADNTTGVVGQFAQAQNTGEALGAAGYVTNSGGINLDPESEQYPDLATLQLSDLLNSELLGDLGLGTVLANVADLELSVGAVAGQASLDGCEAIWSIADDVVTDAVSGLERDYLVTSADLMFSSPTVSTLVTAIGGDSGEDCGDGSRSFLTGLECTVNGLSGNEGVLGSLTDGLGGLLGTLTDGLGLGNIDLDLSADVDLAPVRALLNETLTDSEGVVSINLGEGTINLDTAALLTAVNPSEYSNGLNGLAPNTNPLNDPEVINELTNRVATLLAERIDVVEETLAGVIDGVLIHLNVNINLTLRGIDIGHIQATVDCQPENSSAEGCELGTLLDPAENQNATSATFILLPGLGNTNLGRIIVGLLNGVVGALIESLVENLVSGLGGLLGSVVEDVLGLLRVLPQSVVALTEPIVTTVTDVYSGLFGGLEPVVSITVNAQNTPADGNPGPVDWEGLEKGRYDVAAVRVGVLDAFGDNTVALYLGRASVGPVQTIAQVSQSP